MQRVLLFVPGLLVGLIAGFFLFGSGDPQPVAAGVSDTGSVDRSEAAEPASGRASDESTGTGDAVPSVREAAPPVPGVALDYDPALGTLVYGMVTSRDGTVIDSCRLSFTSVENSRLRRSASVEGGTGFATMGLTPGRWNVYAKPENFAAMRQEIEVLDEPTQRVDFQLEPSFLVTVKLQTPEGQPLHEAIAAAKLGYHVDVVTVASKEPFVGDLPMTELRGYSRYGIGSWRAARGFEARSKKPLPKGVAGTIELNQPPPVHFAAVFRHVVLATAMANAGDREVVLEVPLEKLRSSLSTIRLQVVNAATGQPVEGARVGISDSQSGGGGRPTDAEGRIEFENERVGLLELDIWAKGLEQYYQLLRLTPGVHDLGAIAMHPAREVAVEVLDAAGAPASGVTLQWQNLDRRSFPQPSRYRRSARTDAEGLAKLSGLGQGRYLIQAVERGKSLATTTVDTLALGDQPVKLTLAAVLSVRIAPTSAVPRTDVHCLTIFDQRRVPVWARFLRGYQTSASLPAGRYTWELHSGTQLMRNGQFVLAADRDTPEIGAR